MVEKLQCALEHIQVVTTLKFQVFWSIFYEATTGLGNREPLEALNNTKWIIGAKYLVFGSSRSVKTREADQNHYLLYFTSFLVSFSRLLSPNWVRFLAKVNALVFFGQLLSFWQNEMIQRPNISHLIFESKLHVFDIETVSTPN